ncbi:MAG TPA: ABC transporter substrate-binding protein [Xanthobacteraceae bacterium]|jgi:ABC-type nitrate/sulfonate/bicarbonate transport system substrate-binding protein
MPLTVTRRKLVTMTAAGAATATAPCFPRPAFSQPVKVRYTLSWLPTGQYAFIYSARQLGFFKKRGIDLDISRGFGSLAAIAAVSAGQFDIGGAQTGAILLSIIKGENLKIAATQGYDATLGILVPEKNPIRTPKDLEGRKIGVTPTSADTPFLPAYCRLAGVDFDKLQIIQLDSKILEQSAMSGVVDAILVTGLSSIPNFVSENIPFRMLPYSQVGLQFYWQNTIVTSAYMEKNKELVDNVVEGILEGIKLMLLDPQEAMERHLKEHEELAIGKNGRLYVELGLGMTSAIMIAPESVEHGIGYTDLAEIEKQARFVKQYAAAAGDREPPKPDTFCSNDSAGKITLTAPEWEQVRSSTRKYAKLLGTG